MGFVQIRWSFLGALPIYVALHFLTLVLIQHPRVVTNCKALCRLECDLGRAVVVTLNKECKKSVGADKQQWANEKFKLAEENLTWGCHVDTFFGQLHGACQTIRSNLCLGNVNRLQKFEGCCRSELQIIPDVVLDCKPMKGHRELGLCYAVWWFLVTQATAFWIVWRSFI